MILAPLRMAHRWPVTLGRPERGHNPFRSHSQINNAKWKAEVLVHNVSTVNLCARRLPHWCRPRPFASRLRSGFADSAVNALQHYESLATRQPTASNHGESAQCPLGRLRQCGSRSLAWPAHQPSHCRYIAGLQHPSRRSRPSCEQEYNQNESPRRCRHAL